MPQTIIKERLSLLTPDYQEFIFGGYPEMTANVFAETLNLDQDGLIVFENGIVLFLLFFIDADGLARFLVTDCHVEPHLADEVTSSILKGLPANLLSTQNEVFDEINKQESTEDQVISESTRMAILKQSSLRKIKFYQYVYSKGRLPALAAHYNITEPVVVATFKELINDIILGFYNIEDIIPLLEQELEIDAKTAELLGAEVTDFLLPLSDPTWQPPVESEENQISTTVDELATNSEGMTTGNDVVPVVTAPPTPVDTINPAPNFVIPSNLQGGRAVASKEASAAPEIHTMASDANLARSPERNSYQPVQTDVDDVVHTSNQPDTRQTLSDLPAYTSGTPETKPTVSAITPEPPRWGS